MEQEYLPGAKGTVVCTFDLNQYLPCPRIPFSPSPSRLSFTQNFFTKIVHLSTSFILHQLLYSPYAGTIASFFLSYPSKCSFPDGMDAIALWIDPIGRSAPERTIALGGLRLYGKPR